MSKKLLQKDKKLKRFYDDVVSDIKLLDNKELNKQGQEETFVKNICKWSVFAIPHDNLCSDKRRGRREGGD